MQRILGQPRAIEALTAAYRSGRLHHAWIFAGPRGVGKFTTAVEFARLLLDPGASADLEIDAKGETSRLIDERAHPDLHVIYKELAVFSDDAKLRTQKLMNIPIDVLRASVIGGQTQDGHFHDGAAYKTPVLGHAKVFIIDEAELIDRVGQNALLKTLEEPPRRTYLFLITSRPQRLLPTIHSRCHHVRFCPLDAQAIETWFQRSELKLDKDERVWIEQFCDGSPGRAVLAKAYGFYRWRGVLGPMLKALERGSFPVEMGEAMAALVEEFAVAWVGNNKNASKEAANKDGVRHLLSMLARYARKRLDGLGPGQDPARWLGIIDLLRAAERQLVTNVSIKLLLENLVVQWHSGRGVAVGAMG